MKLRLSTVSLALIAQTALFAAPATFAQDATTQTQPAAQNDLSLARQAVKWSQNRLTELDATIAVLEKESASLQGEARAKADETLTILREKRDAYQAQAEEAAVNAKSWTDAQVAAARKSLNENWTAFQTTRDEYLDTAKADLATRREILEAELEARQQAWQKSIDELSADAKKLATDQRAAIEKRIAALNADLAKARDEAKDRIDRLENASAETWEATKKGYADTREIFFDTYASIRKSIEDATK